MNVTLKPHTLSGEINNMLSSKSLMHRAMICASLAQGITQIQCNSTSEDIRATANVLRSMGAQVVQNGDIYTITPIKNLTDTQIELDFGESGSTMRFILPLLGAMGIKAKMITHGRLISRPLSPLYEELVNHGMTLSAQGVCPLYCGGKLVGNRFTIEGNVSSQFVSGLIFALAFMGGGTVEVTGKIESLPYIHLTTDMLEKFGIKTVFENNTFTVCGGKITSPGNIRIESDWSNASFWLVAGALSEKGVTVSPMCHDSLQGDRKILEILKNFGAEVTVSGESITVRKNALTACEIDVSDIPDLVPIISVLASCSKGDTVIDGIARLRFKESDRVESVCKMLEVLGIKTQAYQNRLIIYGGTLTGGTVDSYNDHRIAMSAAVASCICKKDITIKNADAVRKSYPDFFERIKELGAQISL